MAIFAFILVLLVFLLVRIVYINLKDGKEYEKQVLSQENYDSRTLYSRRGEIQDRNGQLLAYSEKVYRLVIDCKEINNTRKSQRRMTQSMRRLRCSRSSLIWIQRRSGI